MKVTEHLLKLNSPGQMPTEPVDRKTGVESALPTGSEKNRSHKRRNKDFDISESNKLETP